MQGSAFAYTRNIVDVIGHEGVSGPREIAVIVRPLGLAVKSIKWMQVDGMVSEMTMLLSSIDVGQDHTE